VDEVQQEFTCLCGKMRCWVSEGKRTDPCPQCGRRYLGRYDSKMNKITGRLIVDIIRGG
jgi:hypothetical protein